MNTNFYIGINIKCDDKEFISLLKDANIDFYDEKVRNVKFYYDDLTFFFFKTSLSRKELVAIINNDPKLMDQIIEYSFYEDVI